MIPNDQIMEEMSKIALETATAGIATFAREFAKLPDIEKLTGRQVLEAFATAIENTNAKVWPASLAKS